MQWAQNHLPSCSKLVEINDSAVVKNGPEPTSSGPPRVLHCGPSLQPFVQRAAFCRLKRRSADKATFPSLCLDVRFEFITTQPGSFFRCNLNPLSDLIE
jgi:hypothetical protein